MEVPQTHGNTDKILTPGSAGNVVVTEVSPEHYRAIYEFVLSEQSRHRAANLRTSGYSTRPDGAFGYELQRLLSGVLPASIFLFELQAIGNIL